MRVGGRVSEREFWEVRTTGTAKHILTGQRFCMRHKGRREMINAIVFDLDGLIIDTERTSLASWEEAYREAGFELPLDS